MAIKLNCLESLTAIGIGVGACALAPLDMGLTAGAVIGGAGLLTRIRENSREAGLDDEALIARMQKTILREWDHWQDTQERRDAVTLADAGMTRLLPQVMLTREELAATATESSKDRYPAMAARKVVDRLGELDASFGILADGSEPLAREFAFEILEKALRAAKEDKDYAVLLTLEIAIELGRAIAETQEALARIAEQNQTTHEKLDALSDVVRTIVAETLGSARALGLKEGEVIALARRVEPTVHSVEEAVVQLGAVIDAYVRRRDAAERGTNFGDVVDAALREIAARNAAEQFEAGLRAGERAFAALDEQQAALTSAKVAVAQANADQARIVGNAKTFAQWIVKGLNGAGKADFDGIFCKFNEHRQRGLQHAIRFDLEAAIALAAQLGRVATSKSEHGVAANALGSVSSALGDRTGGREGLRLLDEAVAAYRDALTVYTRPEMPAEWAMTQNNLGCTRSIQGERTSGSEAIRLFDEAIAAFRSALTIRTHADMPGDWATTHNDLGNALKNKSDRTSGQESLDLLDEAIAAFRDALTVRTRANMAIEWAMTQGNLGNALRIKGLRSIHPEALSLLSEAVAAHRDALTVRTRAEMPADWATTQNSLGNALKNKSDRTSGPESLDLLDEAIAAFRDALTVYTRTETPARWAATQNNLGNALATKGARIGGPEGLLLLEKAAAAYCDTLPVRTHAAMPAQWAATQENLALAWEIFADLGGSPIEKLTLAQAALLDALSVYTVEHMPNHHRHATRSLARVRAKLAAIDSPDP